MAEALKYLNKSQNKRSNDKVVDFSLSGTSILKNNEHDSNLTRSIGDRPIDLEEVTDTNTNQVSNKTGDGTGNDTVNNVLENEERDEDLQVGSKRKKVESTPRKSRSRAKRGKHDRIYSSSSECSSSSSYSSSSASPSPIKKKRRKRKRRKSRSSASRSSSRKHRHRSGSGQRGNSSKSVATLVKEAVCEQMAELKKCILESKGVESGEFLNTAPTPVTLTGANGGLNSQNLAPSINQLDLCSPAVRIPRIKSPSEATVYSPALKQKTLENLGNDPIMPNTVFVNKSDKLPTLIRKETNANREMQDVVDFLNNIRIEFAGGKQTTGDQEGNRTKSSSANKSELELAKEQVEKEAHTAADKAILDAEKFKATIATPKSKWNSDITNMLNKIKQINALDDDDEFFHSTCHVDKTLRTKIAAGQFIDLSKVAPKQLLFSETTGENKLRLINNNGIAEFKTQESENKITGIRSWDRAFRVYSTIYSEANPARASEILQYAAVINLAAQKFAWEDVAQYDYVFRHLMERKPERSWAKTYTQMWNITLCGQSKVSTKGNSNFNGNSNRRNRDPVCWRFNRGKCKYGKECRFEHRCSYCWSLNHPGSSCHRKPGAHSDNVEGDRRHRRDKKCGSSSKDKQSTNSEES